MYTKRILEPYYGFIMCGVKTLEGRVLSEFWNENLIGRQLIIFNGEGLSGEIEITGVNVYEGKNIREAFRIMLDIEGVSKMLPDLSNDQIEEGIEIYMSFNQDKPQNAPIKIGAFGVRVV